MLTTLDTLNLSSYQFNMSIAEKMREICQPLFANFNITDFGFVKLFRDGTMLRVSTGKAWTQKYFENQFYNDAVFYNFDTVAENSAEVRVVSGKPTGGIFSGLYDNNIWNIFTRYERVGDAAQIWFFASDRNHPEMVNFYFNHCAILDKFIAYFKERAAPILIPKREILITTELKLREVENKEAVNIERFLDKIGQQGFKRSALFSPREKDCLRYLVMGKSAKEIARILQISSRTVEFHINRIKQKVGCKKLAGVMNILFGQGLRDLDA